MFKTFQYYAFCLYNIYSAKHKTFQNNFTWKMYIQYSVWEVSPSLPSTTHCRYWSNSTHPLNFFFDRSTFNIFRRYCLNETQDKSKIKSHEREIFFYEEKTVMQLYIFFWNLSFSDSHHLKTSTQKIPSWANPQSFYVLLLFSAWRQNSTKPLKRWSPKEYREYKRM